MEVKLQKESVSFYRKLADTSFNHEETMEMIVPDTLPDIQEVIDTDGTVILRSKEAENGKCSVSGIVRVHILYIPEGGTGVKNLLAQIPFTAPLDVPEMKTSSKIVAKAELGGVEARIINSRKLILRADTLCSVQAYEPAEIMLSNDVADGAEIESLKTECEINPAVDCVEKTFSFADELSFPASKPPIGCIVKSCVKLVCDEVKTVGTKLIIKGTAYITIVYTSSVAGEMNCAELNVPFSQICELNEQGEGLTFDVCLMPTGIYVQESGDQMSGVQNVSVEIAAVAQITVWKKMNMQYISDVYSTQCDTDCTLSGYTLGCLLSDQTIRETMRETISVHSPARSIVSACAYPGRIRRDDEGFKANICVNVLYLMEDGATAKASGRFDFMYGYKTVEGVEPSATIRINEVFATPAAGGIEVRIPVELRVKEHKNCTIEPVSEIEMKTESAKEQNGRPSVVLCRVASKDSLWSLAKRYNSTRDLIRQANKLEQNGDICENDLLLIAKKR